MLGKAARITFYLIAAYKVVHALVCNHKPQFDLLESLYHLATPVPSHLTQILQWVHHTGLFILHDVITIWPCCLSIQHWLWLNFPSLGIGPRFPKSSWTASLWAELTSSCRCTRTETWLQNWRRLGTNLHFWRHSNQKKHEDKPAHFSTKTLFITVHCQRYNSTIHWRKNNKHYHDCGFESISDPAPPKHHCLIC